MALRGAAAAAGHGRGSRSSGAASVGHGQGVGGNTAVVRTASVTRATAKDNTTLRTLDIEDEQPKITPRGVEVFMRKMRNELRRLREEVEEERDRGLHLEEEEEDEEEEEEEDILMEDLDGEQAEEIRAPAPDDQALAEHPAHPDDRQGPPPLKESVNRVALAREIKNTKGTPAYDEMARRLQEMEQVGHERDQRVKKVDKEMRAQRGEESEDDLGALQNPLIEEILTAVAPPGYVYAPLKVFTGTGDPNDHIRYFNMVT